MNQRLSETVAESELNSERIDPYKKAATLQEPEPESLRHWPSTHKSLLSRLYDRPQGRPTGSDRCRNWHQNSMTMSARSLATDLHPSDRAVKSESSILWRQSDPGMSRPVRLSGKSTRGAISGHMACAPSHSLPSD